MEMTTLPRQHLPQGLERGNGTVPRGGEDHHIGPGRALIVRTSDVEVQVGPLGDDLPGHARRPARHPVSPAVTSAPAAASLTATPRPAGPVPPRIPTCMPPPSHNLAVPMGLLDGKRLLITGVLTDASLAFAVAKFAQEEGAEIVLSGAGRALSLTKRTARKLPTEPDVLEIDVTSPEQLLSRRNGARGTLGPPRRHPARHRLRPAELPG